MALFSNPIQPTAGAPSGVTPEPQGSVFQDVAALAPTALKIWQGVQAEEAKEDQAKAVSQASDLSLSRMQEFTQIRDQKGQVRAMQSLRQNYLEDLKTIRDPVARKSYVDSFKGIFGGSPMDIENDSYQKVAEEKMKRDRELVNEGRELALASGMNPKNFEPTQLALMAEEFRGQGDVLARQAAQVSLAIQQGTLAQSESQQSTRVALRAFGAQFDTTAQARITGLHNALKSRRYTVTNDAGEQVVLKGEEAIQAAQNEAVAYIQEAKASLKTNLRGFIREMGGDPTQVSEADYNRYMSTIETLEDLVTGKNLGKINEAQLNTLMSANSLDAMKNMPQFAQQAAVAKLTGAPVTLGVSANRIAQDTTFSGTSVNPLANFYQSVQRTVTSGPAEAAAESNDPQAAIRDNVDTVLKTLDNIDLDKDQNVVQSGRMLTTAIMNGSSSDPDVAKLANGNTGVIAIHRKLAEDPSLASRVGEGMRDEAQRRGMDLDQVYSGQLRKFYTETLIPSLGIEGLRNKNDVAAKDVITVSNKGGKVSFDIDQSFFDPDMPAVQVFQTGTQVDRLKQFHNKLKKAERDLNIILKSYANVSGTGTDTLVQDIIDAYQFGVVEEGDAE